jgi:hypothetical protein
MRAYEPPQHRHSRTASAQATAITRKWHPTGANIYAVAGAPATSDDYLQSSQAALDAAHLGRDSMKTVK